MNMPEDVWRLRGSNWADVRPRDFLTGQLEEDAPELTLDILKGVVGHKVAEHAQRGKGFGK